MELRPVHLLFLHQMSAWLSPYCGRDSQSLSHPVKSQPVVMYSSSRDKIFNKWGQEGNSFNSLARKPLWWAVVYMTAHRQEPSGLSLKSCGLHIYRRKMPRNIKAVSCLALLARFLSLQSWFFLLDMQEPLFPRLFPVRTIQAWHRDSPTAFSKVFSLWPQSWKSPWPFHA